ncbi:hypothetical protein QFZ37_000964 [Chryseobacterium ginsenosidimutans]|uniref:hypothetical protein n=1 Tax=Chryseobacterium ginsenosidimutans TaxID=687846 RepID=UPI00278586B4|nr:hypothetical protein [Chryseobacterium ginsenosidimutans]MDQ0592595.1 hypothetical protein [Chryseobacterium ginsenosidimutans]
MKNLIIFLSLTFYFISNFMQDRYLKADSESTTISSLKNTTKIVYLFFKVEKTNSGSEKITLQEKKITDGKLKSNSISDENNGNIGDFVISMTNADGKEMIKQVIEDPLNPTMEVYGEDISRKKISLQDAEFSIRYSYSEEIQMVKVEKITNSGKQLLFTQKL